MVEDESGTKASLSKLQSWVLQKSSNLDLVNLDFELIAAILASIFRKRLFGLQHFIGRKTNHLELF